MRTTEVKFEIVSPKLDVKNNDQINSDFLTCMRPPTRATSPPVSSSRSSSPPKNGNLGGQLVHLLRSVTAKIATVFEEDKESGCDDDAKVRPLNGSAITIGFIVAAAFAFAMAIVLWRTGE